jgi:hypothetical protein
MEQLDLISAVVTAVLAIIALGLGFAIRWLHQKTKSDLLIRIVRGVASAARLAVQEVWATYAKALKDASADGSLTDAEKSEARSRAIALLKSYLGAKGLALLCSSLGLDQSTLDKYLGAHVETALSDEKRTDRVTKPAPQLMLGVTAGKVAKAEVPDPSGASATA